MRKSSLILFLACIPLIPEGIALLHLYINGGSHWPMRWNNEVTAWTMILSIFAFISLFMAIKFKHYALATLPVLSVIFSLILFFETGIESSSKSDVPNLELLGFWFSQWNYW